MRALALGHNSNRFVVLLSIEIPCCWQVPNLHDWVAHLINETSNQRPAVRLGSPQLGHSEILARALEHEKSYRWNDAAESYGKYLETQTSPPSDAFKTVLRMAECCELGALQTENSDGFRGGLERALAIYRDLEQQSMAGDNRAFYSRIAKARRLRLESILATDLQSRRDLLAEAVNLHRAVVEGLDDSWGKLALGVGNYHLLLLAEEQLLDSGPGWRALTREGLELADRLFSFPASAGGLELRGETLSMFGHFALQATDSIDEWDPRKKRSQELITQLVDDALSVATQVKDDDVLAALHAELWFLVRMIRGQEFASEFLRRGLANARRSRNRQRIGALLRSIIWNARWELTGERNTEQARRRFQEIGELFQEAKHSLGHLNDPISQYALAESYGVLVHVHNIFATSFGTDPSARRQLLEEAARLLHEGLEVLGRLGSHAPVLELSGAETMRQLALFENAPERKREDLVEAISIIEQCRSFLLSATPLYSWDIGLEALMEGSIRYDLAASIVDPGKKVEMLSLAAERFRIGLEKHEEGVLEEILLGGFVRLGEFYLRFVNVLKALFENTHDESLISEQLDALDKAGGVYSNAGRPARTAEVLWQKANLHSQFGQHEEAIKEYVRSATTFQNASTEAPSLKELYDDFSSYMLAWSRIEEARDLHSRTAYGRAVEAYSEASKTLRRTRRWSPLADHYMACAMLEEAEALSRAEKPELGVQKFREAEASFAASKKALESWKPRNLSEEEEIEETTRWERLTDGRARYSYARAELEEARLLDRNGDHAISASMFANAASSLESLARDERGTVEAKEEMTTLALSCRAWRSMKQAEIMNDPSMYAEAARLFDQAATNQKFVSPLRGHSALCRALETGTRLRATRDPALYPETKAHLESALDYYTEAGMSRAAAWTRATARLFDGLVYQADAERALDAKVKSKNYALSERSFAESVRLFEEAGYVAKCAQATRYMQYAHEQMKVFASPAEALDGSMVLRSTEAQVAPGLIEDQPAGIKQFEGANLQAQAIADRVEITLGESIAVELELVSVGRSSALLVKVSDLNLEGVDANTIGERYRVDETGTINVKGLRLEPFETFTLKLHLHPTVASDFDLRPRVFYLDENGHYRQTRPRPIHFRVIAKVKEHVQTVSQHAIEPLGKARPVFDYLVNAFVDEYMKRRLGLEQAGWRSLSEIADGAGVSRSTLYGRQGRHGKSLDDLIRKGLVETRVFTGQRGRGGEVIRVRIAYDRDPVKRFVDQRLLGGHK